jgi:C4-type Zn-finger protein
MYIRQLIGVTMRGNISSKSQSSRNPKPLYGVIVLILIFLIAPSNNSVSGYIAYMDNNTDGDSDIDSIANIGNSGSTSYSDAQALDGTDQVIQEDRIGTGGEGNTWKYFKDIIIDNSKVAGDLTDFPVLISLFDSDLKLKAQNDGDDIAFFDSQGGQLPHEIEFYDPSYNGSHAQLVAWVKSDLSSDVDTWITMKYGNSEIVSRQNPTAVWNSSYLGVWHLKEDPSASAPQILDSTLAYNGTSYGNMASTDQISGQIDGSIDFDGVDDYINMGSSINIASSSFSVSTWAKRRSSSSADIIFEQGSAGENTGFHVGFRNSGIFTCAFYLNDLDTGASYNDSDWHYWTCTFDTTTLQRTIYRDGVNIASDTATGQFAGSGTFYYGMDGMMSEGFDGQLDEARLLNIPLSSEWLLTEFNNQNSPNTFYSLSNEMDYLPYFDYQKNIIVNSTKVSEDLADFPVLISLFDSDLKNKARSDGGDIAFFDKSGHKLYHEIELFDPDFNGTHAQLIAWVKSDLTSSVDTIIAMKYGNTTMSSQENAAGVWTNNFAATWHLHDDFLDSTGNGNNGTNGGSSDITGYLGDAQDFDGIDDNINVGSDSSIDNLFANGGTASAWIYPAGWGESSYGRIVDKTTDTLGANGWGFIVNNGGTVLRKLTFYRGWSIERGFWYTPQDSISLDQWQHVVVTYNEDSTSNNPIIYINGVSQTLQWDDLPQGTVSPDSDQSLHIGNFAGATTRTFDGIIDEVRLSTSIQSAGWILTEYNNQYDPNTFFSLTPEINLRDIIIEEIVTKGSVGAVTIESPTINGVMDHLYLTVVSGKGHQDTVSVTGLELTWTKLVDQCAGREQTGISIWWGQGYAETGNVTVTMSAAPNEYLIMQVYRISGVSLTDPLGNYVSSNTNGISGACTLGVDDTDPSVDLPTLYNNATVFGAVATRSRTFTPGSGYTLIDYNTYGSGGGTVGIATEKMRVSTAGLITVNGTLSTTSDWAIIAVELIPDTVNYHLEWEHQSQNVDTSNEEYVLSIYGYSSDSGENFEIQMWNATSLAWSSPLATKIGSAEQWYNITISGLGVINPTITWRYRGDDDVNDFLQTSLHIDYAGIASFDKAPEFTGTPSDIEYVEGTPGNTLSWIVTDTFPNNYTIYENASQVDTGTWASGDPINYSVDDLPLGFYNYTIVVADQSNFQVIDTAIVTVLDNSNPVISKPANDLQYSEESTGNVLSWNSTDTYPDTYVIYRNGTPVASGNWTIATNITLNVDGLAKGHYNFTLIVQDTSGNSVNDTAFVTVIDVIDPIFSSTQIDVQYAEGSASNTLSWNSTDTHPGTYLVYRNDSVEYTGNWTNAGRITINVDGLDKGVYNFTIVVIDSSGNSATNTTFLTVFDATPPTLSSPPDLEFVYNTTGNSITWVANDKYPDTMIIYRNGAIQFSTSWTSGNIGINIDGLSVGTYNYTIVVYDKSSNLANDTVIVTVIDTYNPLITSPANFTYVEGSFGNSISWSGVDDYPDNYIIYQNATINATASWSSGVPIVYNIDGRMKGTYNFTIILYDSSGNSVSDTVMVTVTDGIDPSISHPSDIIYILGSSGNTLQWTATDNHPDIYSIYKNAIQLNSSGWISGTPIDIDIDGLGVGVYNYTIYVQDQSGNYAIDSVEVTVIEENGAPSIVVIPTNFSYPEESAGNFITWMAIHNSPDMYIVRLDGEITIINTWINNTEVNINVDGHTIGDYNYTVAIYETTGNYTQFTVMVTVLDNTRPVLVSDPYVDLVDVVYGRIGYELNWMLTDNHPDVFVVFRNGSSLASSNWTISDPITVKLDGLPLGLHNYTILVNDTSGNLVSFSAMVRVATINTLKPAIFPEIEVYEGYIDSISGNWTDIHNVPVRSGRVTLSIINTTNSEEVFTTSVNIDHSDYGHFEIGIDYSNYFPNTYELILVFDDISYEGHVLKYEVTVQAHILVIEYDPDNNRIIPNENYSIKVKVRYNDQTESVLQLSQVGAKVGGVAGVPITLTLELLYQQGSISTVVLSSVSDAEGYATFSLSGDQTIDLVEIQSMSAEIESGVYFGSASLNVSQNNLPLVFSLDDISDVTPPQKESYDMIILIGIGIVFFVIFFFTSRKKEVENNIQVAKKDIFLRLSEVHSIRSILIVLRSQGIPLLQYDFKEDKIIKNSIKQLITAYSMKKSASSSGSFIGSSISRTIEDLAKVDFVNIAHNKGEFFDIYLFSNSKITQTRQALENFDQWILNKYNLKEENNIPKLFHEKSNEIVHGMHIQFDTWTLHKLKTSIKLDTNNVLDEKEQSILNLIVEKEGILFTEVVGKLNQKYQVNDLYNVTQKLLLKSDLEVFK